MNLSLTVGVWVGSKNLTLIDVWIYHSLLHPSYVIDLLNYHYTYFGSQTIIDQVLEAGFIYSCKIVKT